MNEENNKELYNPFSQILIPRLHERKKIHQKTFNDFNNFLGKKRVSIFDSGSKKFKPKNKILKTIIFNFVGEYEENKDVNGSGPSSSSSPHSTKIDFNYNQNKNFYHKNTHSKCFICGKYGHKSVDCREDNDDFCVKCLQNNHKGKECPNEKCYFCKSKGHEPTFCPLKRKNQNNHKNKYIASKIPKCTKCLNNGHITKDCLVKPNEIIVNNISKQPLCSFCSSPNHYICPPKNDDIYVISDYDSDNIILDDDEDVKNIGNKNINSHNDSYIANYRVNRNNFNSIIQYFNNERKKYEKQEVIIGNICGDVKKDQIKNTNFCCKCGKPHYYKDCGKNTYKKYKENNENDEYYVKLKNFNNLIYKKNPLKFEPQVKSEYKINHNDIRYDYYDQNDSSGESFKEMYKKKK